MSTADLHARIAELEAQLDDMFERNGAIKLLIDPGTGAIAAANRAAVDFYGWSREELVGMPIAVLNQLPAELVAEQLALAADGSCRRFEFRHRLRHGELRDVQVDTGPCRVGGRVLLFSIISDITERKRLAEQLAHAQRIEALGLLAGGVAHDFNNLLTSVAMLAAVLERKHQTQARPDVEEELSDLRAAVSRGAAMTSRLLAFCRRQARRAAKLDVVAEAESVRGLVERYASGRVRFELRAAAQAHVIADRGQLEQILLNLAMNAVDAMPDGGTLTIEIACRELAAGGALAAGPYVEIAVRDGGVGIPVELQHRIFEPFFTTKQAGGRGSGLGLSTVFGIVEQNGGSVSVRSAPGQGSEFRVLWPAARAEPIMPVAVAPPPRIDGTGGEVVLLAEDEDVSRVALGRLLADAGYVVLEASDGVAALELARRYGARIDLLLTDIVMPRMGGRQLAEGLAAICPGIHIIYMSGHVDAHNRDLLDAGSHFLAKPFAVEELHATLRRVLGAPRRDAVRIPSSSPSSSAAAPTASSPSPHRTPSRTMTITPPTGNSVVRRTPPRPQSS